jgi:hypothetical protein
VTEGCDQKALVFVKSRDPDTQPEGVKHGAVFACLGTRLIGFYAFSSKELITFGDYQGIKI